MASEYKISTILRSSSGVKVLARFYNMTVKKIEVSKRNYQQYPLNKIGNIVEEIKRTKHKSNPEFTYSFAGDITDEQIHQFLYEKASKYGTPINKKIK